VLKEWWPEFADPFFRITKFTKLLGFVEKWLELVSPETGRIHPSINQSSSSSDNESSDIRNAPATGRLSASGPNVNQVPHHSDERWGAKLRSVFVAEPGWVIMAADAEQEEPRVVSVVANDLELVEAFKNKTDIYRRATSALYPRTVNADPDSKWKVEYEHERYNGKTFFLAWYYGAGAGTLIKNVDASLSIGAATAAVANLASAHPARQDYLLAVEKECIDNSGWVTDIFGRKRFIPEILTGKFRWENRRRHNNPAFNDGLRKAANFKVQGPCATVLKRAIVKIDRTIKAEGLRGYLLFPVHDEVVGTCPIEEQYVMAEIVKEAFQNPIVPLPISVQVGQHWGDMKVLV
jgi:DNA polymerase-1